VPLRLGRRRGQRESKSAQVLSLDAQNPTGAIYPRETIIELAKLAAEKDLHLVMDE
jgi:aspartate/methionine/tyrosine aminotransferase